MEETSGLFDTYDQTAYEPAVEVQHIDMPFLPGLRAEEMLPSIKNYEVFSLMLQGCERCPLRAGCKQVVVGDGTTDTPILFIGEGPGQDEDIQGKPFVGRAGQLLNKILAAAEIPREKVYITNVVKCRPPHNRLPLPNEVQVCRLFLEQQIRYIKPQIIVCLGALAAQTVIDPAAKITKIRGQWYHREGIHMIATFHPAALLRNEGYKRPTWEDFKQIRDLYKSILAKTAKEKTHDPF